MQSQDSFFFLIYLHLNEINNSSFKGDRRAPELNLSPQTASAIGESKI